MKTSTQVDVRSAMTRLAAARPPVANHTEGIVPRAERARLLRSIVEAPTPATSSASLPPPAPGPSPERPWVDATMPGAPRRRVLAGGLVAAVVAAGLAVAGLVGTGDEQAQVKAGPGDGPNLPALAPETPATSFAPTGLPEGVVLQEVSVEPAPPPLPGSPYAEVYGRVGPDSAVEEAVAVITATAPGFVDALLRDSGATTSPVPGQPAQLDIDFGQGLVARSSDMRVTDTVCGTGGCVEIEEELVVMVLGRDLDGGASALPALDQDLKLRVGAAVLGDRVDASALIADGFTVVYEGDQVPGLSPGPQTVLHFGDDSGRRGVTLRLEEGRELSPASLAWQFPRSRPVQVRGHDGLLVADERLTAVTWQERPGLVLSLEVTGFSEDEALALAEGVEEVSEASWLPTTGEVGGPQPAPGPIGPQDSVTSDGAGASGPEVVLGEGRAGDQQWQLVGYEVETRSGSGDADVCIELRASAALSGTCWEVGVPTAGPAPGEYFVSPNRESVLNGQVLSWSTLHPAVATVRFLLDNGETLDVATVTHERFGTHVVAAMPQDARSVTVALLDESGSEVQRREVPAATPPTDGHNGTSVNRSDHQFGWWVNAVWATSG